jgi:hypothetical protein
MAQKIINIGTSANKGDGDPLRLAFGKINDNFTELYTGSPIVPQDLRGSVFGDDSTLLVDGVNSSIPKANIEDSTNWDTAFGWGNHSTAGYLTSYTVTESDVTTHQAALSITESQITDLAHYDDTALATRVTTLENAGYQVAGALHDGDIEGSVFGDDSTLLVDAVNNVIPSSVVSGTEATNWNTAYSWGDHTAGGYAPQTTTYTKTEVDSAISAVNTLDGDFTGSVFGDDSTVLVDGINNKIVGAVETSSLRTSESVIVLGNNAQSNGGQSLSIGNTAISDSYGVAIGVQTQAATYDINVGAFSGKNHITTDNGYRVAVGAFAQQNANPGDETGTGAIAIGTLAGDANQGANAVAIGRYAGRNNQAAKSIVINATDSNLENTTADSLVIKPIRSAVGTTMLMYDATTGEVTHTASPVITGDITGSVFADDSTLLVDGVGGTIAGPISSINWMAASDSYLTISNGGATGPGPIQIVASANLDLSSGTNNDINITPHGSGRVKVGSGGLGIVEAANFIGHADQTMYLSSIAGPTESTHITLNSTSGVQTSLYGAVDFVSGGSVDFTGATVTGLPYATVANTTAGSVTLVVGNVMTAGYLNVRLIDKGVTLGVEFNYDPADFTSVIDAYSDDPSVGNVFDGASTVAVGNTTWTEVTTLSTVGDRITFTLTDHSSHKVYRATVTMRNVPDAGILGAAYAIIELLL